MKTLLGAVSLLLAGCATLSSNPAAARSCGDPCARLSCPSAFVCITDASCAARCQPEPARPGLP